MRQGRNEREMWCVTNLSMAASPSPYDYFDKIIPWCLAHEVVRNASGKITTFFSNIKEDSGGYTIWGISRTFLNNLYNRFPLIYAQYHLPFDRPTIQNMMALSYWDALKIYEISFYRPYDLPQLMSPLLQAKLLDMIINLGGVRATWIAQEANNRTALNLKLRVDGIIGPLTIAALNTVEPEGFKENLIECLTEHYTAIVKRNPTQEKFIKGWLARANAWPPDDFTAFNQRWYGANTKLFYGTLSEDKA